MALSSIKITSYWSFSQRSLKYCTHLPDGYFKKRGLSHLRLFHFLNLNLTENPKNGLKMKKMGGSSQKIVLFGKNFFDPFIAKNLKIWQRESIFLPILV